MAWERVSSKIRKTPIFFVNAKGRRHAIFGLETRKDRLLMERIIPNPKSRLLDQVSEVAIVGMDTRPLDQAMVERLTHTAVVAG